MIHKLGISIITTMFLGIMAVAGSQLMDNTKHIIKIDHAEKTNRMLLLEVRGDVKELLKKR